ncbi:hypothetical protein K439DRAFT_1341743, partial [Ramaria rubella]
IPKPPESVGKPKNGGYLLSSILDWDPIDYRVVQKYVHVLAEEYLDLEAPYDLQNLHMLTLVCQKADKKFLMLRQYADRWATKDFLKTYLWNASTCRKWKRSQVTSAAGTTHEIKEAKCKWRKTVHWAK